MPRLLGDKVLPEAVQSQRRKVREKVRDLRDPIRRKRSQTVPGPNVIGSIESKAMNLRDSFITRESIMSRIKARRSGDDEESSGSSSNGESSEGSRGSNSSREIKT